MSEFLALLIGAALVGAVWYGVTHKRKSQKGGGGGDHLDRPGPLE